MSGAPKKREVSYLSATCAPHRRPRQERVSVLRSTRRPGIVESTRIGTAHCRQRLEGPAERVALMETEECRFSSAVPLAIDRTRERLKMQMSLHFVARMVKLADAIGCER